jgi:hypothetical protein
MYKEIVWNHGSSYQCDDCDNRSVISISIGGIISAAILIAAATLIQGKEVTSVIQL